MGREWYNGGRSICSSKSKKKSNEASGCITALHHFFHFHHFYFPSRHHHHQPSIDSPSRNPQGLVAPRNSLDLTEESPSSTNYKLQKEILNIHVGGKKSTLRALLIGRSSSNCNSPRTKAPNVVARLMGLDLLPDNLDLNRYAPRIGVRGHRDSGNGSGTRSLPVSPRISSDSDNRRLSLQLNRENKHEEFARRRLKELKQDEGSPSLRHNEKQIKESVTTRKFGKDITNLLENTRAGAAQNKIEHSRFSQKENTTSINPTFVLRQDQISQKPASKVTLPKDFKENLKGVNESRFSPHPTPKTRNKQRRAFKSISTHVKSEKKKCKKISKSNDTVNISVASSAFSATERPRKQMKRAEAPERNADATICSVQMHKYEKKLPQEPPSSNFYDSTTTSASLTDPGGTVVVTKKLEDEEERVIAEIERHIVDALVHETVETMSSECLNANAIIRYVGPSELGYSKPASAF